MDRIADELSRSEDGAYRRYDMLLNEADVQGVRGPAPLRWFDLDAARERFVSEMALRPFARRHAVGSMRPNNRLLSNSVEHP